MSAKKSSKNKTVKNSRAVTTHLVLPSHTNTLGSIFGGKIMEWIDIAASIAAMRHCRKPVVTASIDDLHFLHPVRLGDMVIVQAEVTFTGKTSMEIYVTVHSEQSLTGTRFLTSTAFLTFVAIDDTCKPVAIPKVVPETEAEKKRFLAAKRRKEERLNRLQQTIT